MGKKSATGPAEEDIEQATGPVWCEGYMEVKSSGWLGRWSRRYFVLRRRSLAYYASYHAYSTGDKPLQAARVVFVRLPEGDFGEARVLIGTRSAAVARAATPLGAAAASSSSSSETGSQGTSERERGAAYAAASGGGLRGAGVGQKGAGKKSRKSGNNAPWLVQPDNRSEQCRWVNALWWALEPTEDELRQLQISYDMLPPAADGRSRRRSSTTLRKPDSLIIHKARAERRQKASHDSRPESADGPGKRNGRNSIIQPAVDPMTGEPVFGADAGAGADAAAGGGGDDASREEAGEPAPRAKKRVTFRRTVAAVHTLPEIPDFDITARRSLFYSVYDIMQFQHDAERPFDVVRDQLVQFCNRWLFCNRGGGNRIQPSD